MLGVVLAMSSCGQDDRDAPSADASSVDAAPRSAVPTAQPDFTHVHGLGVNPRDGALFIATHEGLYRAPVGRAAAQPVGDSRQDVMGFTVVGPDRFLGSGHPDPRAGGPPYLGLISTVQAGATWMPVSLSGQADFHVLRAAGSAVYGFNGLTGLVMASRDQGRTWQEHRPPAPLLDLAIAPQDDRTIMAATTTGLFSSSNAGSDWRVVDSAKVGLLSWTADGLYLVNGDGRVSVSSDGGKRWRDRGEIGGQPAAFTASGSALYAARADGTVLHSKNRGGTWTMRARP